VSIAVAVAGAVLPAAGLLFASPVAADSSAVNTVSAFGGAIDYGPAGPMALAAPLIGMAPTKSGNGYWLVAGDGGIFTFGDAPFLGSMGGVRLNRPVVGMGAPVSGSGYWEVASDGGIFSFGVPFYGSMGGIRLNQPMVGMAPTRSGNGYWLVASDGGIFTFGDAPFLGSMGGARLNQPVVGMAATPSGHGYWLVAADGGIFTFGDAAFFGSGGGGPLPAAVTGMAASPDGMGYWMVARNGQVFPFGVPDLGSAPNLDAPTVGMAAHPVGGYWLVHGQQVTLGQRDQGPQVVALQQRLTDLSYWLPISGVYDDLTTQAVYAFQKVNGLPITGNLDTATSTTLDRAGRPGPRSGGDLLEIDKSRQVLFVVRGGQVQWTFNVSTGTERPYTFEGSTSVATTPTGTFHIFRQVDGVDVGRLGRLYRPKYFNGGIAIHGYTFVPPYPASHGCVRVTDAAIDFIWGDNLAPIGETVFVYGTSPGT